MTSLLSSHSGRHIDTTCRKEERYRDRENVGQTEGQKERQREG
jgi:hypothetical protein